VSAAPAGHEPSVLGGKLRLSVVTPEATAHDGPVDVVVVPGHDGEIAFYPGHAAFVGLLGVGELRFHASEGGTKHFFLAGGVVQVVDDRVSVLAETVVPVASLSAEKARKDLAAAIAMKGGDPEAEAARTKAILSARGQLRLAEQPVGATAAH
jgi:F-type H+-transporting ATPase subunit epsilon